MKRNKREIKSSAWWRLPPENVKEGFWKDCICSTGFFLELRGGVWTAFVIDDHNYY